MGQKRAVLTVLVFFFAIPTFAQEELALFDGTGRASAYVADDGLTVYLWTGEPVAYLSRDSGHEFHVYGFNGRHLGWFVGGVVRDHKGDAACAIRDVASNAQLEPLKDLKRLKPFKNLEELAPLLPLFSRQWAELPCRPFLSRGSSDG